MKKLLLYIMFIILIALTVTACQSPVDKALCLNDLKPTDEYYLGGAYQCLDKYEFDGGWANHRYLENR